MSRFIVLLLLVLLALPVAAQDATPEMMAPLPDQVVINVTGILPEGVEYDPIRGGFLFGSLSQGTIHHIDAEGNVTVFAEAEGMTTSVGIHVDALNNRLLVANTSFVTRDLASLFAFDLETGELVYTVDMSDLYTETETTNFANDVTADADGNAYVTDSFSPVIYKVTPEGEASIFAQSDLLAAPGFGLNGIDIHPDGYLLAAVAGSGAVYKILLDDPTTITAVTLPYPIGIDGMALDADNNLVAVGRPQDGEGDRQVIAVLSSSDDWESASITLVTETMGEGTTLALADGAAYYINAYFANPVQEAYEITRVDYVDMMMGG